MTKRGRTADSSANSGRPPAQLALEEHIARLCQQQKIRSDILVKMFERFYVNFDQRRAYEWKLSFGIWAALAVFISLVFKGELKTTMGPLEVVLLLLCAGAILILHIVFLFCIKHANDIDKMKAWLLEDELLLATDVCTQRGYKDDKAHISVIYEAIHGKKKQGQEHKNDEKQGQEHKNAAGWWAVCVQSLITTTLLAAAAIVVLCSSNKPTDAVATKPNTVVLMIDPNTLGAAMYSPPKASTFTISLDPNTLQALRRPTTTPLPLSLTLDPNALGLLRQPLQGLKSLTITIDPNTLRVLKASAP